MNWLREAISDEEGLADIAYVSILMVAGAVLGAISFVCAMAAWSYWRCVEVLTVSPPIICRFDPVPIGQSVIMICGGFSTALGALAGYMLATRRQSTRQPGPPAPPPQLHVEATATTGGAPSVPTAPKPAAIPRPRGKRD